MRLHVHKDTEVRVPSSKIAPLFEMIVEGEAKKRWDGQVNLVFTDDRRMRKLNHDFRSKDRSTDVLSFNIDDPNDAEAVFGEIYISVPFARRQAESYGGTMSEEILRLFSHGLLHLFGYDHHETSDSIRMEKRHEYYLRKLREVAKRS